MPNNLNLAGRAGGVDKSPAKAKSAMFAGGSTPIQTINRAGRAGGIDKSPAKAGGFSSKQQRIAKFLGKAHRHFGLPMPAKQPSQARSTSGAVNRVATSANKGANTVPLGSLAHFTIHFKFK